MDNHEQTTTNKKQLPQQQSVPPLTATFRSQSFAEGGNQNYQRASLLLPPNRLQSTGTAPQQQTVKQAPRAAAASLSSLLSQKRPASEVQGTTTTTTAAASPLPCIPSLPPIHVLERNHLVIDDDGRGDDRSSNTMAAAALVDRIVDFLRVQSIAYTTNEADAGCLDCTTASRLNFVIQLWRSSKGNNNSSNKIIVEIQRRQGCCIEMNSIRRGLVQEVMSGGGDERRRQPQQQMPPPQAATRREGSMSGSSSCNKRPRTLPPHNARLNCEEALKICLRLLESDKNDQEQLGWESLNILTNPMYCSQQDAQMVSRAIVLGDSLVGQRLQQGMQRVLTNHNSNDQTAQDTNHHHHHHQQQPSMLHHLALQTLANALELASPTNLLSDFWQAILIVLFRDFDQATTSPQEGAWSAKCIRLLMPRLHDQKLPQFFDASSFEGMVSKALKYGKARHLSLEQESSSLLKTML